MAQQNFSHLSQETMLDMRWSSRTRHNILFRLITSLLLLLQSHPRPPPPPLSGKISHNFIFLLLRRGERKNRKRRLRIKFHFIFIISFVSESDEDLFGVCGGNEERKVQTSEKNFITWKINSWIFRVGVECASQAFLSFDTFSCSDTAETREREKWRHKIETIYESKGEAKKKGRKKKFERSRTWAGAETLKLCKVWRISSGFRGASSVFSRRWRALLLLEFFEFIKTIPLRHKHFVEDFKRFN